MLRETNTFTVTSSSNATASITDTSTTSATTVPGLLLALSYLKMKVSNINFLLFNVIFIYRYFLYL